jgi:hypothetical protein
MVWANAAGEIDPQESLNRDEVLGEPVRAGIHAGDERSDLRGDGEWITVAVADWGG